MKFILLDVCKHYFFVTFTCSLHYHFRYIFENELICINNDILGDSNFSVPKMKVYCQTMKGCSIFKAKCCKNAIMITTQLCNGKIM